MILFSDIPIIIGLKGDNIGDGILDFSGGITDLQLAEYLDYIPDVKYFLFSVKKDNAIYSIPRESEEIIKVKLQVGESEYYSVFSGILCYYNEGILILERKTC